MILLTWILLQSNCNSWKNTTITKCSYYYLVTITKSGKYGLWYHDFYIGTAEISHHENSTLIITSLITGWELDYWVRNRNNIVACNCWNLVVYYTDKLKINLYVNNSPIFSLSLFLSLSHWLCLCLSLYICVFIYIFPKEIITKTYTRMFILATFKIKQSQFVPPGKVIDWLCCSHTIEPCTRVKKRQKNMHWYRITLMHIICI